MLRTSQRIKQCVSRQNSQFKLKIQYRKLNHTAQRWRHYQPQNQFTASNGVIQLDFQQRSAAAYGEDDDDRRRGTGFGADGDQLHQNTLAEIISKNQSESAWQKFIGGVNSDQQQDPSEMIQLLKLIASSGIDTTGTKERVAYLLKHFQTTTQKQQQQQQQMQQQSQSANVQTLEVMHTLLEHNMLSMANQWFAENNLESRWPNNQQQDDQMLFRVEVKWIQRLIAGNDIQRALEIFKLSKQRCKDQVNPQIYSAFVSGFSALFSQGTGGVDSRRHLESAVKFLVTKRRLGMDTQEDLAQVVSGLFLNLRLQMMKHFQSEMVEYASAKTFNRMMSKQVTDIAHQQVQAFERFVRLFMVRHLQDADEQQLMKSLEPTALSGQQCQSVESLDCRFNLVYAFIHGYSRLGMYQDALRWFKIYQQCPDRSFKQTLIWNTMLLATGRQATAFENVNKSQTATEMVWKFYQDMEQQGVQRDSHTKAIMLQMISKSSSMTRLRDTLKFFDDNVDFKNDRMPSIYSIVIDCCIKSMKDLNFIKKRNDRLGVRVLEDFMQLDESTVDSLPSDITLVELLIQTRNPLIVTHRVLQLMKQHEIAPSVVTYTSVIQGFFDTMQSDDAMTIYNSLKEAGMSVDLRLSKSVLEGLCRNGRYEEAMAVFEDINSISARQKFVRISTQEINIAQYSPDVFQCLIYAYGLAGHIDKAEALFQSIDDCQHPRSIVSYDALLNGYAEKMRQSSDSQEKNQWYMKSLDLLRSIKSETERPQPASGKEALQLPLTPSLNTYSRLMLTSAYNNRFDTVMKFLNLLIKDESILLIDDDMISLFLRCLDCQSMQPRSSFYSGTKQHQSAAESGVCDIGVIKSAFSALLMHPMSMVDDSGIALKKHYGFWKRSLHQQRLKVRGRKIEIGPASYVTYFNILKRRRDGSEMLNTIKRLINEKIQLGERAANTIIDLFEQSSLPPNARDDVSAIGQSDQNENYVDIDEIVKFEDDLKDQWDTLQSILPENYYSTLSSFPTVLPTFDDFMELRVDNAALKLNP